MRRLTNRLLLLGVLWLIGCTGPSLGREHSLVYVRTGPPGQFNIPATNVMQCDRLWLVKVTRGSPPEDGTTRFGAGMSGFGPRTITFGDDEALVCSFEGTGPTPNAPNGFPPLFSIVLFPTGEVQQISANGLAATTAPAVSRIPAEILRLCPFPRQYIAALHPFPYPSKVSVEEATLLDQWAKCAGPKLKAGGS